MPDRIIHESALTSPTLHQLSDAGERAFWRLTVAADDHGCFEADPAILIGKIYPRRIGALKPAQMERIRDELAAADLIELYTVDGRIYGHFVKWQQHQRRRESKPKFPLPDNPAVVRGELPPSAARARTLGSRESRDERRETGTASVSQKLEFPELFETTLRTLPRRHVSHVRGKAERAWNARIREGVDPLEIMAGAERYARLARVEGIEGSRYICHAATFFGPDGMWREAYEISGNGGLKPRERAPGDAGYTEDGTKRIYGV